MMHARIFILLCVLRACLTRKFTCEEDGFFQDPTDCTGYYVCADGTPTWEPCPEHLRRRWESSRKVYCDIPDNVKCLYPEQKGESGEQPSEKPVLVASSVREFCLKRINGIYKNPIHCSKFIMCSSSKRLDFDCPDDMGFSENHGICVKSPYCSSTNDKAQEKSGKETDNVLSEQIAVPTTILMGENMMEESTEVGSGEVEDDAAEMVTRETEVVTQAVTSVSTKEVNEVTEEEATETKKEEITESLESLMKQENFQLIGSATDDIFPATNDDVRQEDGSSLQKFFFRRR